MGAATTQDFKVIGTRPIRHDGVDKVTGRAKYGADYSFPNMLHGKVLRSPHAHARIKSINVAKALAVPGVKAVLTGKDFPELPNRMEALGEIPFNPYHCAHNVDRPRQGGVQRPCRGGDRRDLAAYRGGGA